MAFGLTQQATVNEIFGRFQAAWTPTGFTAIYPDTPLTPFQVALLDGTAGQALEPWARLTIRTTSRTQGAFGSGGDARRWDTQGILIVEIYTPIGSGLKQTYELYETVKNAYEGVSTDNGVWYRDCRPVEVAPDGEFSRVNLIVEWRSQEYK